MRDVIKWPIANLKEHPRQGQFFGNVGDDELAELAADMAQHGQREPVHILEDGTIVAGHQRVLAAMMNGWTEIDVIVRTDLADASDDRVLQELISDNLIRRRLDDLAIARCYRHLKIVASKESRAPRSGDRRDGLSARLGYSGRQLDRLKALLDLPRPIQDAISGRLLSKSHGEAILKLAKHKQKAIAADLASGQPIHEIVKKFGLRPKERSKSAGEIGQGLLNQLAEYLPLLNEKICELDQLSVPGDRTIFVLGDAAQLFAQLRDRHARLRDEAMSQPMPDYVAIRQPSQSPDKMSGPQPPDKLSNS